MSASDSPTPRLLPLAMRPDRRIFRALPFLGAVGMGAGLLLPEYQKQAINDLLENSPQLWFSLASTLCALGVSSVCHNLLGILGGRCSVRIFNRLRQLFARKLLDMPKEFFQRHPSGYLTSRLELDTASAGYFYSYNIYLPYLGGLGVVIAWGILLVQNLWIAGGVAVALLVQLLILRYLLPRSYALHRNANELAAENYGTLHHCFSNMDVIKTGVCEEEVAGTIARGYAKALALSMRLLNLEISGGLLLKVLPGVTKLSVLGIGIWAYRTGHWSAGEIWATLAYTNLVFSPAAGIAQNLLERAAAQAALDRMEQLYAILPEEHLEHGVSLQEPLCKVEFQNVAFAYPDSELVLNHLSFVARTGDFIAITGPSGAGKSTLISLLLRLYVPQAGAISYNDVAAEQCHLRNLRRKIGYVSQNPQFFPGTLLENLGREVSRSDAATMLERVGAAELSPRLDEVVGERGAGFSTGELVRIAIARELLRHTDVLVLDEPTANLDDEHANTLMRHLTQALSHKIVFVVTHHVQAECFFSFRIELTPLDKRTAPHSTPNGFVPSQASGGKHVE